jgi:hypothetical protein
MGLVARFGHRTARPGRRGRILCGTSAIETQGAGRRADEGRRCPARSATAMEPERHRMHYLQELGYALLIASPYLLPKRLEPLRIVAVMIFTSFALHVIYR